MSNLKNIKNRINSIASTQKITKAMKMIAAAKVKKAENAVKSSRPFTWELFSVFAQVHEKIGSLKFDKKETENPMDNYAELLFSRPVETSALVVISSNKGLAGAYSSNIVRHTTNKIKELRKQNKKIVLYLVGQKAYAPLKSLQKELGFEIKKVYTTVLDNINAMNVLVVSEDIIRDYVEHKIDKIELVTTRYQNMMTYKAEDWTLLPALEAKNDTDILKKFHQDDDEEVSKYNDDMVFEPNPYLILSKIMPMYITNVVYQALLEAQASELASRMTAMSAATNNAQEMIQTLTVEYNKARQDKITQELNEVVSGAEGLK